MCPSSLVFPITPERILYELHRVPRLGVPFQLCHLGGYRCVCTSHYPHLIDERWSLLDASLLIPHALHAAACDMDGKIHRQNLEGHTGYPGYTIIGQEQYAGGAKNVLLPYVEFLCVRLVLCHP